MAAIQPPSPCCHAMMTLSLLALLSVLLTGVRTQASQNAGSQGATLQSDTHGLFNVYFIPAYRVATNHSLKAPPANAGIVFRAGLVGNRQKSTTTEKPVRITGAASDIHPEQQSLPQDVGNRQDPSLPIRSQASAITQYLLGFSNGYQSRNGFPGPNGYQQANGYKQPNSLQEPNGYQPPNLLQQLSGFQQNNGFQQPHGAQQANGPQQPNVFQQINGFPQPTVFPPPNGFQQPNGLQQQNGFQRSNGFQQPNGYQQQQPQQYNPTPLGYFPFSTRSPPTNQQNQGYFPFPPVYIPPSIIPKSATEPPPLPQINANYRASASVKDESIIKSAQISVTPTLATAGPIYATAADEIQTTIEPAPNSTVPDATITAPEERTTSSNNKSTTVPPETAKTSVAPTSTSEPTPTTNATVPDSKTSPATAPEARTSVSPDSNTKSPESSSTEKAQAEEHRSISRHFEFSEDKEHSQVNATGDIRLTATRKTSMEGESSQKSPPAAQSVNPAFPTFPSLPINTPHPHSHPHPAIIQGPNGFFVGSYNPTNQVGVIPPPSNDPYNSFGPFGHSAALSQGGFHIQPTSPTRYEDLYYGFAPGFPFGVPPSGNGTSKGGNVALPPPSPQQAQQAALPPNQPLSAYHPGPPQQYFDVAGPRPYSLPQQVPYNGYSAQPFQTPGDYSRFSNEVLQPPVGRPFYAGDPALPNPGYNADLATPRIPNQLYSGDTSGPSAPSRLYSSDPAADALVNRGFVGGPSPFINPGFSRSDSVEANSGLTNFVSPVRGVGSAYEVKPGSGNTLDNYDRRASRRDSIEADGDSEQVVY